jgi:phenylpropionate dioxygenase-like ring-hydroxylating dioxygenase large terminal subunit
MGAYFRFAERKVEKKLRDEATSGVVKPAVEDSLGIQLEDGRVGDRRALIPILGLREYWYPAIKANRISKRKPKYWRMLGDEICFFRTGDGGVGAVSDICPHRGASISRGSCVFKGTVSCPYHGATFDESGQCKAFTGEGPASQMVGKMQIKTYPTKIIRGWVFIWMGESQPAPIEEDVPPEFFQEKKAILFSTYTYWPTSWIIAIENQNDSHNSNWAHMNSMMQLTANRGRSPTPVGPRSKLVKDRALVAMLDNQKYYKDEKGHEQFSLYYPEVGGFWPHNWRKAVWWVFRPFYRYIIYNKWRMKPGTLMTADTEEWCPQVGGQGWHLPCQTRINHGMGYLNRFAVPVTANLSRVTYIYFRRYSPYAPIRALKHLWWHAYFKWWLCYNFSGQDAAVAAPCRYWTKENLAPTDSHLILLRKLVTERSRDAKLAKQRGDTRGAMKLQDDEFLEDLKKRGLSKGASLDEAAQVTDAAPEWNFLEKTPSN